MNKITNLILIVFVMFGFLLSINSLTVSACEDDGVIDEIIIVDENLNQDFDNDDAEASTNDIVIEDDNNPDGVFLLGVEPNDETEQE